MKKIFILVSILICFGSANGQEENIFISKYFLGWTNEKAFTNPDEFYSSDINCSHLKNNIWWLFFQREYFKQQEGSSIQEKSDILNEKINKGFKWSLDEEREYEKKEKDLEQSINYSTSFRIEREAELQTILPIYSAFCK